MYEYDVQEWIIPNAEKHIFGKIYTPKCAAPCPAIIFSHGYNGCHTDFDTECRFYAARGFIAYAFDFCGGSTRSRSSLLSTEMTLFSEKSDLLAVFDAIRALPQVDSENMYLLGGSQGGLITALAAEERASLIKGLILYFPAMCIPENWRTRYPQLSDIPEVTDFWGLKLGRRFFSTMHDFDSFAAVGGFQGKVLLITGDCDQIVSLASVERTAARYQNAELVVLPGEGHGFTPAGNQAALARTMAWMGA